ncbi:MAG: SpoIIE family protein phosphatase [Nostocaceae cyanobacterium]|nr:SpoIIE family protein phosphatase [Nostocaceae cyanobacterium]
MHTKTYQKSPLILLADDDKSTRIMLNLILKQDGYRIIEVENGEQCLAAYKEHQPDMVLLDAIMPEMDGFTCCEKLHNMPLNNSSEDSSCTAQFQVPVLMITGLEDKESVDRAFAVGATDFVTKPIRPAVLRQRLRRLLEASWAEKALRDSEKKYRSVVNSLKEVIFQTNTEGQFTFLNSAWEKITGFLVEESLGKNFVDFIHPNDRQWYLAYNTILMNSNHIQESTPDCRYQLRYIHRNGSIGWIEIYACLMLTADNNPISISGTLNDITELKRQEQYQKIEYSVTQILAESATLKEATPKFIRAICRNFGWAIGELWSINPQQNVLEPVEIWYLPSDDFLEFKNITQSITFKPGIGLPGIVWENNEPLWISNLVEDSRWKRVAIAEKIGLKSGFAVPINSDGKKIGVMTFFSCDIKYDDADLLTFLVTIGSQIGQFIKRKQAEEESQKWNLILQSELEQAAKYVRSLLPSTITGEVNTEQIFVPSTQLGGDIFDYYWLDDNNLVIYLVDVAGHGIKSALLSVSVLNILRTQSLANINFYQPVDVLKKLNYIFKIDTENGENYFSIWYGVYKRIERELVYSCAGHPPAILIQKDSNSVIKLSTESIPIGILDQFDFDQETCKIEPETTLYVFSDGVYEIMHGNGKVWGLDAFVEFLLAENKQSNLENIFKYIQKMSGQSVLDDDFSLLKITFC